MTSSMISQKSRVTFFNKLADSEVKMKVMLVWETVRFQTFRDYHDLYLKGDMLLLADFFEKFRDMCLDSYSAAGMAWDSALNMTKINLELFIDEDKYTFIERSIRGGISQISKANNPCCDDYNPMKPITNLISTTYMDGQCRNHY